MADSWVLEEADLTASAATVTAARRLAEAQARLVRCTTGCVDELAIDLLFLAQESVLVFEEAHSLLTAIATVGYLHAPSDAPRWLEQLQARRTAGVSRRRRRFIWTLLCGLTVVLLLFLFEVVDPMSVIRRGFLSAGP